MKIINLALRESYSSGSREPILMLQYEFEEAAPKNRPFYNLDRRFTWDKFKFKIVDSTMKRGPDRELGFWTFDCFAFFIFVSSKYKGQTLHARETDFTWADSIVCYNNKTYYLIKANMTNTGNIDSIYIDSEVFNRLVEEGGLEWSANELGIYFSGDLEKFRKARVYKCANGITYGLKISYKSHKELRFTEEFVGAYYPSKKEAQKVANDYLEHGRSKLVRCDSYLDLIRLYPDSPLIDKLLLV